MISSGFELLVMEMIGVMGSNWRMSDVADTPSSFGITISYDASSPRTSQDKERDVTHHQHQIILFQVHFIHRANAVNSNVYRAPEYLKKLAGQLSAYCIVIDQE